MLNLLQTALAQRKKSFKIQLSNPTLMRLASGGIGAGAITTIKPGCVVIFASNGELEIGIREFYIHHLFNCLY